MVQEPPPRCCAKQARLQLEALRRERKSGVQASPWSVSSCAASLSAQRRVDAWTRLLRRLVPMSSGRTTRPWSSCQTSISRGAHWRRAMISKRCMT
eukprot:3003294-Amphidinium_carterae.1